MYYPYFNAVSILLYLIHPNINNALQKKLVTDKKITGFPCNFFFYKQNIYATHFPILI